MSRTLKVAFVVVDDRFTKSGLEPLFGAAPTALLQGFEELDGDVEVHVVCCTMGHHPKPDKIGKNIWFHSESVPKWGFLRTLHSGCIRSVNRMISRIDPDIVHAQGTERWCAISTAFLSLPKILTIHGNLEEIDPQYKPKPRPYWKLQTLLQKISVPKFDGVFCNSDYTEQCMRKRARKTWRVDNPIRAQFFSPPSPEPPGVATPVILNIGIFQVRKRQLEILHLAKKIHTAGGSLRFRFIGKLSTDPYGVACQELLQEGERLGYAEYAGTMTPEELIREMDQASGFVHCPSEEAFGLVVAESLARGLKFFGTSVGGIKDITRNVPGCELFGLDDWEGTFASIMSWLQEGAPRQPGAMPSMAERYTPKVIAMQHMDIYREVLTNNRNKHRS